MHAASDAGVKNRATTEISSHCIVSILKSFANFLKKNLSFLGRKKK